MSLFQKSVLKRYLAELSQEQILNAYQVFQQIFNNPLKQQNILNSKEEQYQEGFLRELFVKVLGYVLNPDVDYNLITEQKNEKDSKKADGAILNGLSVIAVIELKSTKTVDLASIESQAFGYKNNQQACKYVITSNFRKLRFYIDNAVDFEEFDLFNLSLDQFKLLWICLSATHLLKNIPAQIKEASNHEEENVTKKLYADYAKFRTDLFQNIILKNPDFDKLILFKKTQKLLDRFLFLFFAEDRGLVSPNWTRKILQDWTDLKDKYDNYIPLYNRFRKNFDYLNTGYSGKDGEIFAYNGGLFAPDDILDSLTIDDDLLYKGSLKLSNYDFESEVDVNILGHIFEHSLNEIDEIQASLMDEKTEKVSKRKKDGVFYTPKYITKYIVENTIGTLCKAQKEKLEIIDEEFEFIDAKAKGKDKAKRETLNQKITDYRNWLLELKIVDPACGSGAFLNQALEFLIAEHTKLDELKATLLGGSLVLSDVENSILENNLYGVDINEEAVEIAKLSLWLRTARKGRKLNSLNQNLKCGNSLIDAIEVAGDKAFNWNNEFKEVFEKGGFDVVIGNPPYVNSKEEMFSKEVKDFFIQKYKTSAYQIDLYILFLEKSLKLISEIGISSLIVPNSWLNNLFLDNVRKFFLNNSRIVEIVSMSSNTFLDANVDTTIVTFENSKKALTKLTKCINEQFEIFCEFDQMDWLKQKGAIINVHINNNINEIFKKLNQNSISLEDIADIGRGVGVYHKRVGHTKEFIERDPYQSAKKEDSTFLPYLRGRNVQSGYLNWNDDSYISYGKWLAEPRDPKFFTGQRVVLRQIPSERLIVAYLEQDFVIDQSVFIARFYENAKFNPKSIMSVLGSKLMTFYFKFNYSEFDELFPKVKLQHFKSFPISEKLVQVDLKLGELSNNMIELKNQLKENSLKFQRTIQRKFELSDLPRKLQEWHLLSFNDFIKVLAKIKVKLKLAEEAEWEDFFKVEIDKLDFIKAKIDSDENLIDMMVYELYELTEEEIRIVEGK